MREGNFLGVVARSEWGAVKASQTLKASWSKSETLPDAAKLWEHVRSSKVARDEVTSSTGNVGTAFASVGAKTVSATYDFAIHTHGTLGPSCAVAELRDGRLTVTDFHEMMETFDRFDIQIQASLELDQIGPLAQFAVTHGMTTYDAAYVQLALHHVATLATLDNAMRRAAAQLNIPVLPTTTP